MRFVRFALLPLLLLVFAASAFALDQSATSSSGTASTGMSMKSAKSPEDMGKEALAKWKDVLKITDEQAPQFEAVMTDSYKKMADARTAAGGDKAKMKASMQSIMKERDEALAKVLTPDQMKTYHAKMKEMSSSAKKHMSSTSSK
jgi:Spy/CpxP family protein refolding chaperone